VVGVLSGTRELFSLNQLRHLVESFRTATTQHTETSGGEF